VCLASASFITTGRKVVEFSSVKQKFPVWHCFWYSSLGKILLASGKVLFVWFLRNSERVTLEIGPDIRLWFSDCNKGQD
jgi:hypothetical protein